MAPVLTFIIALWLVALAATIRISFGLRDRYAVVVALALLFGALIPILPLLGVGMPSSNVLLLTAFSEVIVALLAIVALSRISHDRTLAESGLRQTETQFKTLVKNLPDGFRIAKDNVTVYANRRFCEMLGYEEQELIGSPADIVHFGEESRDLLREQAEIRSRGESSSYEVCLRRKDGSRLPVIVSSQPVLDADGEIIASCGVFTDISERERTEKGLRGSEKRFRDFAEAASDRFWELDENLYFTFITGPADEDGRPYLPTKLHCHWSEFVNEETIGDAWAEHEIALREQRPFRDLRCASVDDDRRIQFWRLSGRPNFDEDGRFLGYRGTAGEMTAQIEALQQATEAQAVLMSALNSISDGFAVFDENDHLVLYNQRYAEIYPELAGIYDSQPSFESIVRRGIAEGLYEHECESDEAFVQVRLEQHKHVTNRFLQRLRGNRWVQIIEREIPGGGRVGVWTDVTELKRREQELVQAQKMEAVGQLTGGIAHDFNNLLAVVLGNLEILQEGLKDDLRLLKFVRRALNGARRGAALTQRLLTFSRKQRLQPCPVDVKDLISGMVDLIKGSLGESIEVKISFTDDLGFAEVDPHQLETALLNLALNSRDAMLSGGTLNIECTNVIFGNDEVSTKASRSSQSLASAVPTSGAFVMIRVSDSGIGLKEELQSKIFEPFFTTKDVGRGSGLGLSMVYGFVTQSGGHVTFSSEENKGTTVTVYLPISSNLTPTVEKVCKLQSEPQGKGETILVVEDDDDVRELTREILDSLGYRVLQAAEAASAMEIVEGRETIDLLLADVVLPGGVSGPELAKQSSLRRPDLKVLFFSGYTQHAVVGQLPPGIRLLNKPFRKVELARMVRESLDTGEKANIPTAAASAAFEEAEKKVH